MNNSKKNGAIKTVALMIAAMCLSKVLGMLRSVLMAHSYGISHEATVFSEASRIPLTFFDMLLGSAVLGCFIPIYNSYPDKATDIDNRQKDVFASVFINFVVVITSALSVLGVIFSRQILSCIAAGLSDNLIDMAVTPLRIMFPMIVFIGTTYTLVGILQSKDEFLVPAFVSALSNLLIIVYFIFFNKYFGIIGLSVCYVLSWLVQLLTLIIPLSKKKFRYSFCFDFKNKGFIHAIKMTPPIMLGAWLTPVSILISLYFAAFIKTDGAVASFEYANSLFTIIAGILTYGVCNFIFPRLSRLSGDESGGFVKTASDSLFYSFMIILPVMLAVLVLPEQIVSVVYQRGNFDALAAQNVSSTLSALAPGMLGFTVVELLNRVFYARQSPYIPMISAVCGIFTNAVSSYIMIKKMQLGLNALGFCFALGLCAAALVLIIFASLKLKGFFNKVFAVRLLKLAVSCAVSFGAMKLFEHFIFCSPFEDSLVTNLLTAGGTFAVGVAIYLVCCEFTGLLKKE